MPLKLPFLIFLSALFTPKNIKAQHCPFDYAHILVVRVAAGNDSVIPNLKITVKDSLGNTLMTSKWNGKSWRDDTLKLWQNPQETTHSGVIDNENPMNPWLIRFWFANDNYVLVGGNGMKKAQLVIEDPDGKKNGGRYETRIVPFDNSYVFPLCTGYSHWDMGEKYGFVKGYKPLVVTLRKID